MSCGTRIVGDSIVATSTFYDVDDALTNPTSITWRLQDPSGDVTEYTEASPEVANPSVGVWTLTTSALTEVGRYVLYVVGSGGGAGAAEETTFQVGPSRIPA